MKVSKIIFNFILTCLVTAGVYSQGQLKLTLSIDSLRKSIVDVKFQSSCKDEKLSFTWFEYLPYLDINDSIEFNLYYQQGPKRYKLKKIENAIPDEELILVHPNDVKSIDLREFSTIFKEIICPKNNDEGFIYAVYIDRTRNIKILSNKLLYSCK
ncbi:hypothetical protein [Brumimicrobium sp.]|uniref:hypothetical protein n=1 Tax=Brumimicrobium sp. TaxID=2029867 RepID=UPI003A910250